MMLYSELICIDEKHLNSLNNCVFFLNLIPLIGKPCTYITANVERTEREELRLSVAIKN